VIWEQLCAQEALKIAGLFCILLGAIAVGMVAIYLMRKVG